VSERDEIRARINQAVEILTPLAKSSGAFTDLQALRMAIMMATHAPERAELLANYRLPPCRCGPDAARAGNLTTRLTLRRLCLGAYHDAVRRALGRREPQATCRNCSSAVPL
jgi:hypothetical protein